jgi:hypothetical protein
MLNARDFDHVFKSLLDSYCLLSVELDYVPSVYDWCRANGIDEPDRHKPIRLVVDEARGCRVVVSEVIEKRVVEGRINALRVRSALVNAARNRADRLDSEKKQLAYLFLGEYAATLPEFDDELIADEWVFKQMEKLGFFRE